MKNKSLIGLLGAMVLTGTMALACMTGCAPAVETPETPTLEAPTKQQVAVDVEGNPIYAGDDVPFSSALVMTSFASESATAVSYDMTLVATVLPTTATDKTVDYTAKWKNSASAWATGKVVSDYVTITQETSGSVRCGVNCLQAFGEPVVITVTSRQNPNAKAECQVDFAQAVLGARLDFYNQDGFVSSSAVVGVNGKPTNYERPVVEVELGKFMRGATPNYTDCWGAKIVPVLSETYTVAYEETSRETNWNNTHNRIYPAVESGETYDVTLIDLLNLYIQEYKSYLGDSLTSYVGAIEKADSIFNANITEIAPEDSGGYDTLLSCCANSGEPDFYFGIRLGSKYHIGTYFNIYFQAHVSHNTNGLKAENVELNNGEVYFEDTDIGVNFEPVPDLGGTTPYSNKEKARYYYKPIKSLADLTKTY